MGVGVAGVESVESRGRRWSKQRKPSAVVVRRLGCGDRRVRGLVRAGGCTPPSSLSEEEESEEASSSSIITRVISSSFVGGTSPTASQNRAASF